DVSVTAAGGAATVTGGYIYVVVPGPGPISPNQGPTGGGNTVFLVGTNLSGVTAVTIGGHAATITSNTPTMVTVLAPAGLAGPADVAVTTAGGTATGAYAYAYVDAPAVYALSPGAGPAAGGAALTVSGTGLKTTASVTVGGAAASFTVVNDMTLAVTTPAGTA